MSLFLSSDIIFLYFFKHQVKKETVKVPVPKVIIATDTAKEQEKISRAREEISTQQQISTQREQISTQREQIHISHEKVNITVKNF